MSSYWRYIIIYNLVLLALTVTYVVCPSSSLELVVGFGWALEILVGVVLFFKAFWDDHTGDNDDTYEII